MPSTSPKAVATTPIQKAIGGTINIFGTVFGIEPTKVQISTKGEILVTRHKDCSKMGRKTVIRKMPSMKASMVASFTSISPVLW